MVFHAVVSLLERLQRRRNRGENHTPISVTVSDGLHEDRLDELPRFSPLYMLAKCWSWEPLIFRCETHPAEVCSSEVDENGSTVLHWVSFGHPPVQVVGALLSIEPRLSRIRNNRGLLPLQDAANIPDHMGSYALHKLCDYGCSLETFRLLLEAPESKVSVLSAERSFNRRPLHLLDWRKSFGESHDQLVRTRGLRLKQQILRLQLVFDEDEYNKCEDLLESYRETEFWRKVSLLVAVEVFGRSALKSLDDNMVLHALATIVDCSPSLREFGFLLLAHKLLDPNEMGDVCLHTAIKNNLKEHVFELLQLEPLSASVADGNGDLPLALAIRHAPTLEWVSGICSLVEANPSALNDIDLQDKHIPYIWHRLSSPTALFKAVQSRVTIFEHKAHKEDIGS